MFIAATVPGACRLDLICLWYGCPSLPLSSLLFLWELSKGFFFTFPMVMFRAGVWLWVGWSWDGWDGVVWDWTGIRGII